LGISPLLLGSGKLETPCERMHREKASGDGEVAETAVPDEPLDPVDDDPPPHPPANRASPPTAMAASTVREL
jgi:hypothetical protein